MRVLLVNTLYPPQGRAGPALSVERLARGLVRAEHEAVVVCRSLGAPGRESLDGVRVYRLASPRALPDPTARVLDIVNAERPDVVHTNLLLHFAAPKLLRELRGQGRCVVHTLRELMFLCEHGTMFTGGQRCVEPCEACHVRSDRFGPSTQSVGAVVGVSRFVLDRHLAAGQFAGVGVEQVIPNSYEVPASVSPRPQPTHPLRFGFLGRLMPYKGIGWLIDQWGRPELSEHPLMIAGAGDPDSTRELADRAPPSTQWLGHVPPARLLDAIDVLIVPSLSDEAFGRVVVEAFAHAVPVLASARGGLPELITPDHDGWLFDPAHPQELIEIVERLAAQPSLVEVAGARARRSAGRYTDARVVTDYLDVYARALAGFTR